MMFAIKRADGGVSILNAEEDFQKWQASADPSWLPATLQPISDVPTDRTFRNAWKAGANGIEHDMPKAREIKKAELRRLREPLLAALDVEFMRADEEGSAAKKKEIASRKQALRDMTDDPAIAAAQTPEALKSVMPAVLLAEQSKGKK